MATVMVTSNPALPLASQRGNKPPVVQRGCRVQHPRGRGRTDTNFHSVEPLWPPDLRNLELTAWVDLIILQLSDRAVVPAIESNMAAGPWAPLSARLRSR